MCRLPTCPEVRAAQGMLQGWETRAKLAMMASRNLYRKKGKRAKFRFIWRPFGGCIKVALGLGYTTRLAAMPSWVLICRWLLTASPLDLFEQFAQMSAQIRKVSICRTNGYPP